MLQLDDYRVWFKHNRDPVGIPNSSYTAQGMTTCIIERSEIVVSTGKAWCSFSDIFCKGTGRKLSFTRALSAFDRPTRAAFWKEYLGKTSP